MRGNAGWMLHDCCRRTAVHAGGDDWQFWRSHPRTSKGRTSRAAFSIRRPAKSTQHALINKHGERSGTQQVTRLKSLTCFSQLRSLHYIPKYNRYEKRHKNLAAHCSPAFRVEAGDIVTVGQCRPLTKVGIIAWISPSQDSFD